MRRRATTDVDRLIARVPIPVPWSVEGLAEAVSRVVRRPIQLLNRGPVDNDRIYATVIDGRDGYYVFVRDDLRGIHRDQAVCHELGHLLAGHLSTVDQARTAAEHMTVALPSLSPGLIERMLNRECCNDADHEREAERIATALLARGRDRGRPSSNPIARGFGEALQ